jgi:hypothetical protein
MKGMRLEVWCEAFLTGDFLNCRNQLLVAEMLELLVGVPHRDHAPSLSAGD